MTRALIPSNPWALSLARTFTSDLMAAGEGSGLIDVKPMSFSLVTVEAWPTTNV